MSKNVFYREPAPGVSSIEPEVAKQLKVRRELVSKKYIDPDFTQAFLSSNYSWLRMVSGIEIDSLADAAKKFQLLGGALDQNGKKRKGFNFSQSFLNDTTGAAYTLEKEGIKPMPGITSFSIENMGAEGLLRQVNVTVHCHSLEQFSIMEKLYLRPGYFTFLEWGHSVYIDRSGGKVYNPTKMSDDILFAKTVKIDDIKEAGAQLITNSQHNYDFIIAQIMNYDWSYNDGTYELDIQMIGEGGLSKMNYRAFNVGTSKEEQPDEESAKEIEYQRANKLAGPFGTIMKIISEASGRGIKPDEDMKPEEIDQGKLDDAFKTRKVKKHVDAIVTEIGDGFKFSAYKLSFLSNKKKKMFTYIPLRFIFGCINYFFLPRIEGTEAPEGKFSTTKGRSTYLTFEDHYSIDPYVCLLPQQAGKAPLKTAELEGDRSTEDLLGDLMDIWVNTGHIYDLITAIVDNATKSEDLTIANFIQSLMKDIEGALGSINDFVLYNDYYLQKDLGPSFIRDNQIPHTPEGSDDSKFLEISSMGKESLLKSMTFNTNVDQSMLVTLTAQAVLEGADAAKSLSKGVAAYSFGLKNRFTDGDGTTPQTTNKDGKSDEEAQKKTAAQVYEELYKQKIYNPQDVKDAKPSAASALQNSVNEALVKADKHTGFVIPGNLSITMLGIGGLKRLEYFKLPYDNLPESYKDNEVIFMIDKVNHTINSGQWETNIDAFVLKL